MTLQERLSPGKYKLRVEDYELLADAGAFGNRRTELIEGDVIVMAPEYRQHAYARDKLAYSLQRALELMGSDLHAASGSVLMSDDTMPQPDIVLTREPRGRGAIPLGSVMLLVEVSATTLNNDIGLKQSIYARHDVAEYWVVDVNARVIHQMWGPSETGYAQSRTIAFGAPITATTIVGLTIETNAL